MEWPCVPWEDGAGAAIVAMRWVLHTEAVRARREKESETSIGEKNNFCVI